MAKDADSGSPGGNDAGAALDAAFDKAFDEVGVDDSNFAPLAGDEVPAAPEAEAKEEEISEEPKTPEKAPRTTRPRADKQAPEAAPVAAPVNAAPAHWPAADRDAFGKLPAEAQQILTHLMRPLEQDYHRKTTELARERDYARSIYSQITDEHRRQMREGGFRSDAEGISRLLQLNDFAQRDFPGYVRAIVNMAGGDPRAIFPEYFNGQPGAPPPQAAPRQGGIPPTLGSALQPLWQKVESVEQRQAQAEERRVIRAIDSFRKEKDANGNPAHPYLDERLEYEMAGLMSSHPDIIALGEDAYAEKLAMAYNKAVASNTNIADTRIQQEVDRRVAEATKAAELEKARRARGPLRSPTIGSIKPSGNLTLDEAYNQARSDLGV